MRMRSMATLGALVALLALPAVASATMPGENGRIVFSAETSAGIQMFTVRPSGGGLRQITHVAGDALNPDWSPNGHRIVFALGTETSARLAIVRADGTHLTAAAASRRVRRPAVVFAERALDLLRALHGGLERRRHLADEDRRDPPGARARTIPERLRDRTQRVAGWANAQLPRLGRVASVRRRTRSRHVACSPPGSTAAMSSRSVRTCR